MTPHCAYSATTNAQNQFTTSCLNAQGTTERDTHYEPKLVKKCYPYNAYSRKDGHNERCSYTSTRLNNLKPHSVKFPYHQKNLADMSMPQLSMNMHMLSHTSHPYTRKRNQTQPAQTHSRSKVTTPLSQHQRESGQHRNKLIARRNHHVLLPLSTDHNTCSQPK